jgi:2-polyprenyl-6-methoxyphenol hydroxylase-like FAD-dependent oxidoreductase
MTQALIIGGGIAGATTALALGKAGIESTVYEAYPDGADDTGAFLMVMHNGLDALRAVDALDAIMPSSFRTTRVEHIDATGHPVSGHTIGVTLTDVDGPRTLRRADLYQALQKEVRRRGGRIEHSKRLVRATTTGRRVIATFADGSRAEGDLLVGADGIRSTVRTIIDPTAPAPRYTGENVVFGYTRDTGIPPASETFRMIHGSSGFSGYTTSPNGETLWVVHLPGDEMTAADRATIGPSDWRDRILHQVAGDDTPVAAIVRASGTNIMASSSYDVPSTAHWHTAHLVLVGVRGWSGWWRSAPTNPTAPTQRTGTARTPGHGCIPTTSTGTLRSPSNGERWRGRDPTESHPKRRPNPRRPTGCTRTAYAAVTHCRRASAQACPGVDCRSTRRPCSTRGCARTTRTGGWGPPPV